MRSMCVGVPACGMWACEVAGDFDGTPGDRAGAVARRRGHGHLDVRGRGTPDLPILCLTYLTADLTVTDMNQPCASCIPHAVPQAHNSIPHLGQRLHSRSSTPRLTHDALARAFTAASPNITQRAAESCAEHHIAGGMLRPSSNRFPLSYQTSC